MANLTRDVRTIVLHMIVEQARHAGHLDIAARAHRRSHRSGTELNGSTSRRSMIKLAIGFGRSGVHCR